MKGWKGREGGMHESVQIVDLQKDEIPKNAFAFVGFCCDEGVRRNNGRVGAKLGPAELRCALSNICVTTDKPIIDCGDVVCDDEDLEAAQKRLSEVVRTLITKKTHPIILGGGHEISLGSFMGIKTAHPKEKCGIINFDAHFDLRDTLDGNKGSSGTSFWQISQTQKDEFSYACLGVQKLGNSSKLFKRAEQLGVRTVKAESFHNSGWEAGESTVEEIIRSSFHIYLTICMDVFATPHAPGVSSPQPFGIIPWHIIPLLRKIASSGKVVAFDVAELSPPFDMDGRTAKLAATLIAEFINATP